MPELLSVSSLAGNYDAVIDRLGSGECVALPTETVYGLAGDATDGEAVAKIFDMKGRPHFNPLICHVASLEMGMQYGRFDEVSAKLAQTFWPGPLTIVVARTSDCAAHDLVMAGLDTIALRCPDSVARDIIERFGKPLAAPSANRSGRVSPTTAEHVAEAFADEDLLIVDGGPCTVGIESTIVKVENTRLVLLRPGSVTADALEQVSGLPVIAEGDGKIQAPGMMKSHYAPNAKVTINQTRCPKDAALLAFGEDDHKKRERAAAVINLSETGNLREAAANLYSSLKALDTFGTKQICVEPVPMEGLGLAINDRLKRAAAPREP